jgi:hypothetical protein
MIEESFKFETTGPLENSTRWDKSSGTSSGGLTVAASGVDKVVRASATGPQIGLHVTNPIPASQRTEGSSASSSNQMAEVEIDFAGTNPYPTEVLSDAPRGYWRLSESSGATTIADSSGNGHNGTPQDGPTLGSASLIVGTDKSANFDVGTLNRISVSDHADFTNSTVTAECWVKMGTFPTGSTREWLVSKWVSPNQGWILEAVGTTGWRFFVQNGATSGSASSTFLNDNGTHHLVGRTDGTTVKIYVDGVERASGSFATTLADNAAPVEIGGWNGSSSFGAGATIDEVAVYNGPLSPARIMAHYQAGLGSPPAGTCHTGVVLRYVDDNNYVAWKVQHVGTRTAQLVERKAGVDTVVFSSASPWLGTASTGKGALRLEVVGRRARMWLDNGSSYVIDRPPDFAATLSTDYTGSYRWGMFFDCDSVTSAAVRRFRAADLPGAVMPPPTFVHASGSTLGMYLNPVSIQAQNVSGSAKELQWQIAPADPTDYPDVIDELSSTSVTTRVFYLTPGFVYDVRIRERLGDGSFSPWSDYQRFTVAGIRPTPLTPTLPTLSFPAQTPDYVLPRRQSAYTTLMSSAKGRESATASAVRPRGGFTFRFENRTDDVIQELIDFWDHCRAGRHSFAWTHDLTGESYALRFSNDDYAVEWNEHDGTNQIGTLTLEAEEVNEDFAAQSEIVVVLTLDPSLF